MLTPQRNASAVTQRRSAAAPQLPAPSVMPSQARGSVAANANLGDALKSGAGVALAAAMLLTSTPQPAQANRDALEQTIRASDEVPRTISKNAERTVVDVRQSTVGAIKRAADSAKQALRGDSSIPQYGQRLRNAGDDRSGQLRKEARDSKSPVLGNDGFQDLRRASDTGNPLGGLKSAADDASSTIKGSAKDATGAVKRAAEDAKRNLGVSMNTTSNVLGDLAADTTLGRDPVSGLKEATERGKNILGGGSSAGSDVKSSLKSVADDAKGALSGLGGSSNKDITSNVRDADTKTRTNLFGGAGDDRSAEMRAKAIESKSVVLGKDQGPIDLRKNTPEGNPIGGIKSAADDASSALGAKGAAGSIKDAARDAKRNLGISMAPTNVLGDLAADTTLGRDPVSGLKEATERGKNILGGGSSAGSDVKSSLKSVADDAKGALSGLGGSSNKDITSNVRDADTKTRTNLFGGAGDDRSAEMRAKAIESKSVVLGKDQGPIDLRKNTPEGNPIGGIKSAADDASSALGAKGAAGSIKDAARDATRNLGISMAPTNVLGDLAADTTLGRDPVSGLKEATERGKNILGGGSSAGSDVRSSLKSVADDAKGALSGLGGSSNKDITSNVRDADTKTRTNLFGGAGDDRSAEMRAKAIESKSVVLGKDQGPIDLRKNTPEGNPIGGIKSAADDASSALGAKGAAGSIKDAARDAKRNLGISMGPTSFPLYDVAENTVSEGVKDAVEKAKNILTDNSGPSGPGANLSATSDSSDRASVLGPSGKAPRLENVNPGGEAGTRLVVNPASGDFGKESDRSRDALRDPTKNDQRLESVKNANRQIRDTIVDQSSTNALGASAAKGAVQDVKDTLGEAAGGLFGQAEKAKSNLQQAASDKGKLNVNAVNVKDDVNVKSGGAGTANMGDNDRPGQTNRPFGGWSALFGSGKN